MSGDRDDDVLTWPTDGPHADDPTSTVSVTVELKDGRSIDITQRIKDGTAVEFLQGLGVRTIDISRTVHRLRGLTVAARQG